ncbi:MAG: 16S rRNA (cytosine(1402)-N(4))-methyltransferase RsmH [Clostridia bacterium]|nr:16S rRNA (cytosine(1402)-N(4))-methyltransferase RsmH [Clostridia bacterium]
MEFSHKPVILERTIESLGIKPDGIYLDGTAGGGGHSSEILKRLDSGRLVCVDQDPDAIGALQERFGKDERVTIIKSNFSEIPSSVDELSLPPRDGVLLDIGVSSHQLDSAQRGFSYHSDAPLDMRMSQSGETAAELVNTLSFGELVRILSDYGEEKFAKGIVRAIEREREKAPIETTLQLAEIVRSAYPAAKRHDKHPARKTFQALRIAVNGELDRLSEGLDGAFRSLKIGGRLSVITFHSLEDRMVKQRMAGWCEGCICPKDFPVCVCGRKPSARLVYRKPVTADEKELEDNPRSRSAKLRCCERTGKEIYI